MIFNFKKIGNDITLHEIMGEEEGMDFAIGNISNFIMVFSLYIKLYAGLIPHFSGSGSYNV